MPIYKQTTEITNIDDLLSSVERDIEEIYFGDKQVFTVWNEYDGTLPATYSANGSALADYRVYGSTGGVGDKTENILDESMLVRGYYQKHDNKIEIEAPTSVAYRSFRQSFAPGTYTISFGNNVYLARVIVDNVMNQNVGADISSYTVTTQTGDIGFSMRRATSSTMPWNNNPTMLTPGSTAPASYVPYGYGLSLSVTSPKSYTCEVDSLQASTNYAKIAVAELPTAKVGDKITVTVGGTDYSLPVKNVDNSYVYIENMEV